MFYILKRCTERAFSTYSGASACAIVNHLNAVLSRDYLQLFDSRITSYQQSYGASAQQSGPTPSLSGMFTSATATAAALAKRADEDAALCVACNNLDISTENMQTLQKHLEEEFQTQFPNHEAKHMIKHCLDDLEQTAKEFKQTAKKVNKQLSKHCVVAL